MKRLISTFAVAGALGLAASGAQAATKLEQVKSKGFVQCGVSQGLPGFSTPDDKGSWTGLDVDFCRAVASAVLGDPSKVKYTPLSAKDRFTALQSGDIDILSRNTTWTITRDTSLGLNFTGVTYYDGQGFMIRKDKKVNSAMELSGASICTQTGTTTEQNLADFFRANNMNYEVIAFATNDEVVKAYDAGRCDVLTTDRSGLAGERLKLTNPDDHIVLPEIISKEPLGPVVAHGDDQWFDIVKWVLFAQLNAEELGVTSKNVDEQLKSTANPEVKRLLGTEGKYGEGMGIGNDWAYLIIKNVGNYGEMYDKNVGPDTPLKLARGVNALWSKGGLQYAPPIR
ncbi:amino acid ABC transporter substrate-binding protein [Ancylobacter radicis]|uniref:Amino acid ABC transporter substrate-binding protein n=1 Tax=Ancylobacter radicis TaxID=2836179 RepID=A0ABS5RAI2_9HYPH|nr:amino acid ABC transporter substrate-binding protein [Ancylobacter radicis]MBS9477839.1 amino acid ABC transporter substrate-binding protein [Ancylobacter radicis]